MKKKLTIIISCLIVLITQSLLSQNCSYQIDGNVQDLDDGEKLEFATLYLLELKKGAITDEKGYFKLDSVCEGNYTLKISHLGCGDTLLKVFVNANVSLKIKLPHLFKTLQTLEVKEHFEELNTQAIEKIEQKTLDKTRGQSLGEALKEVNGVTSFNTGSNISKPMIHGLQGYRILILNNGVRQEGQQWGNEHAPEIDPFIATKISVIKGVAAVRYGSDAMAGVILLEPAEMPDTSSITGEFNVVGFSNGKQGVASGILQGYFDKLKGFSWRLQGTYRQGGNLKTPDYFLRNTGIKEYNFSYALAYHRKQWGLDFYYSQFNTKIAVFTGSHIGNLTDLYAAFNASKPKDSAALFSYDIGRPYQDVAHELIKGKAHLHTGVRSKLYLNYAWQYNIRKEYDKDKPLNDSLAALNKPELDYRLTTHTSDLVWEHFNIRSFRGQYGLTFLHQENVYLGRFLIPNFVNNTFGAFALERFVKPRYEIEAGVRYDEKHLQSYYYEKNILQKPYLEFKNISWNAGFIFKKDSSLHVFLNTGTAWRSPAVNELYANGLHHGSGAIERGDKTLRKEIAYNAILTASLSQKMFKSDLSAYYNFFDGFIYQNPAKYPELTIKGAFPVFNYAQANVSMYGFDTKTSFQLLTRLIFEHKFMMIRARNLDLNDHLIYIPADRNQFSLKYTFNETRFVKDFTISAAYQYIHKQWRVPQNVDYAEPPKAYGLLSSDLSAKVVIGKQVLIIGIAGYNLLNIKYRDYLDRFRYYTDAIGRNIQVRIKIPFTLYDKK